MRISALALILVCAASFFAHPAAGEVMKPGSSSSAVLHDLENFANLGSVLYIAAHPDDENTELLTYLARGRNYRTAYLSLTRGDGGQNVLGPDLSEKLGVARTQELLAARRLDGAQQFFTRAVDFGYSKNYSETLNVWNKQEILSDVVRVIRTFRPDVLITRFTPDPGGTHGHHTASATLAMEAFKLAGDAGAFPEQGLPPWQAKRIMWNISKYQKDKAAGIDALKIDAGGIDSSSGETFLKIAERSRAMHKTQGFDNFQFTGTANEPRLESFHLLAGAPMTKDIMDGVDPSWNRVSGASQLAKSTYELIGKFNSKDVPARVNSLLSIRDQLDALKSNDSIVQEKRAQLDRILQECLGLSVETTIAQADVVPGETLKMHHSVTSRSEVPVKCIAIRYPQLKKEEKKVIELKENVASTWESSELVPTKTPLTQPWWLRKEGTAGLFVAEDPKLIGSAENGAPFPVEYVFEVAGKKLVVADEPISLSSDSTGNKTSRRLDVIPPVSLNFASTVALLRPAASRSVEVQVTATRAKVSGSLRLEAPAGWKVTPAREAFQLKNINEKRLLKFTVTAPKDAGSAKIVACAEVNGGSYRNQRVEINYSHIPVQLLQPEATMKCVSLDLQTQGHKIGYIPGAGDSLSENMQEMGYAVEQLDEATLTAERLSGLDAVVIGVRAFNVREKIGTAMPILLEYVKNGGTVIVQYNRPDKLKAEKLAPYDLHISADRVTDEKATMTFLAPDHPVLNKPNKITNSDFDGWVQERGIYFPDKWDEHFTPILACNDAGEAPTKGALLVAPYGKGYYIYTGLVFFRELPAGVPGAYRLFANMLSIGK